MSESSYVHVHVNRVWNKTGKAILITAEGKKEWVPRSQLADGEFDKLAVGDEKLTVSMTEWIANMKGFNGED